MAQAVAVGRVQAAATVCTPKLLLVMASGTRLALHLLAADLEVVAADGRGDVLPHLVGRYEHRTMLHVLLLGRLMVRLGILVMRNAVLLLAHLVVSHGLVVSALLYRERRGKELAIAVDVEHVHIALSQGKEREGEGAQRLVTTRTIDKQIETGSERNARSRATRHMTTSAK